MNKSIIKIWGVFKFIIGIILIIIGFGTIINLFKAGFHSVKNMIAVGLPFLYFEYFGFYLVYCGRLDIKRSFKNIHKLTIWIGMVICTLFVITYVGLMFGENPVRPDLALFLLISFFLFPILVDIYRLYIRK